MSTKDSSMITEQETVVMVAQTPLPKAPAEPEGRIILHEKENYFVTTTVHKKRKTGEGQARKSAPLSGGLPASGKRMATLSTRLMPSITPINPITPSKIPIPAWLESTAVWFGFLACLIGHALNMFNFPRYELDEGTYMSSAWAIMNGMITPYPYGYGHPPLAWMQIAALVQALGGFFTFGNAINTGRVIMLFYALGCALLVYHIVRRLGASRSAGLLAMIVFSLSPLSITYQRQVLLDNVSTFWLLLALYFLVSGNSRMLNIVLSALAFGISLLSKEVFILFFPVMIYAVWLHTTKFQRKFALVSFVYTVVALGSTFILMAILKGELFPASWHVFGDNSEHLSLVETYLNQTKRGQNEGQFITSWKNWVNGDVVIVVFSIAATAINAIIGIWKRKYLMIALLAISFWLLLIRGGVVLSFYFIPLIPLAAINGAMAITAMANWLVKITRIELLRGALIFCIIAAIVPYNLAKSEAVFNQKPTSAQTAAMAWVRQNVPNTSFVVINSYLYMDLRHTGGQGASQGATYPYAHVYFNVATDPELRDKMLQNNWDRIDYIVADSEMISDINGNPIQMKILKDALDNSMVRAEFRAKDHDNEVVIQILEIRHKIPPPVV